MKYFQSLFNIKAVNWSHFQKVKEKPCLTEILGQVPPNDAEQSGHVWKTKLDQADSDISLVKISR